MKDLDIQISPSPPASHPSDFSMGPPGFFIETVKFQVVNLVSSITWVKFTSEIHHRGSVDTENIRENTKERNSVASMVSVVKT